MFLNKRYFFIQSLIINFSCMCSGMNPFLCTTTVSHMPLKFIQIHYASFMFCKLIKICFIAIKFYFTFLFLSIEMHENLCMLVSIDQFGLAIFFAVIAFLYFKYFIERMFACTTLLFLQANLKQWFLATLQKWTYLPFSVSTKALVTRYITCIIYLSNQYKL